MSLSPVFDRDWLILFLTTVRFDDKRDYIHRSGVSGIQVLYASDGEDLRYFTLLLISTL